VIIRRECYGGGPAGIGTGGSLLAVEVPEQIEVEAGTALTITWPDGTVNRVVAAALRASCECASCLRGGGPPRIFDAASVRIVGARPVGAYGVNFTFAPDDHHTGIYPYDRLRLLGEQVVKESG
jgi:DUF971 family protein